MNPRYLYFTVFSAGMTTLAIEFTASRLLGSVFGTSNLVWASIIGLILIYLTVGYFVGGWWADRSPYPKTFYTILIWGAFLSGLIPFVARPVLRLAADAFDELQVGVLAGSFTAVLVLFSIPITLLGVVSPFAIRLALRDSREAGQVSGRIYAISTLGSFVGTFLPVLVMIPLLGTTRTFVVFGLFLSLVAIVGFWVAAEKRLALIYLWVPVSLVVIAAMWGNGTIKTTTGQIYETESAYNYIQVLQDGEYRYLRLNEGQGIHSIYHPEQLAYQGPWMQFLAAPFFNPTPYSMEDVRSYAIVGLAAGTTARQVSAVYGPIPIDGYEIDPEIIRVGQAFFDMNQPNLNPIPEDGRIGLAKSDHKYSVIGIDAYRPPYIPWHLTTQEFFQEVYEQLEENGVLVINIGRAPEDRRLIEGLVATIGTVFPSVYVMDIPDTFNSIVYATRQPTTVEDLYQNYQVLLDQDGVNPILLSAVQKAIVNLQPNPCDGGSTFLSDPSQGCVVFTDDWAPIEWITNSLVLNYVLFSGMEEIQ
ncbi:spermidine synthase [Chloroflexota bacterium]